jgi:hypothetical protein
MTIPSVHVAPERLRLYMPQDWSWDAWKVGRPMDPTQATEEIWSPLLCTESRTRDGLCGDERFVGQEAPREARRPPVRLFEPRRRGTGRRALQRAKKRQEEARQIPLPFV